MIRGTMLSRLTFAAAAMLIASSSVNAGLLPTQVTVVPDSGNYRWTYAIVLPTDSQLQSGNYFTIYDFAGYVPGSAVGPDANWTVSTPNSGATPTVLLPQDDPNIVNLQFTYSGPTIPAGQLGLGNFAAISTFEKKAEDDFTAETYRTSDGLKDSNITTTDVPTGVQQIPEPATMALAALGLPLLGLARLRRKVVA